MSSGPHDTTVSGVIVRYKIYAEKNKKPKIKFCVGFDVQNPTPEREWDQFRSDGDAEAVVQEAAQKLLGNNDRVSGGAEAGPSQPIGPREQAELAALERDFIACPSAQPNAQHLAWSVFVRSDGDESRRFSPFYINM